MLLKAQLQGTVANAVTTWMTTLEKEIDFQESVLNRVCQDVTEQFQDLTERETLGFNLREDDSFTVLLSERES